MKIPRLLLTAVLGLGGIGSGLQAAEVSFIAQLGDFENPPTGSPGTGFATVTIDDVAHTLRIDVTFSGLTGTTVAAHIHCCAAPPSNSGVATQTPSFVGFPLGVQSGSYSNTFDMTSAASFNPAFITAHGGTVASAEADLFAGIRAGQTYLNLHTSAFPGGEIRAFLIRSSVFQVRYAANLSALSPIDSYVNITNTGSQGAGLQSGVAASITGSLCANVYVFSPDEQMASCCSCPVTPNGLVSLSAKADLIGKTLTPAVPSSVVIKIVGSLPVGGSCNNSAATVGQIGGGAVTSGLLAWGSTSHATSVGGVPSAITETPFSQATLSAGPAGASIGELARLTQLCNFILANGSGYGVCASCRFGALGAGRK